MRPMLPIIMCLLLAATPGWLLATTIHVNPERTTVGAAVKSADAGDTVVVHPGTYREHGIVVDKPLALLGLAGACIDAQSQGEIITVTAPGTILSGLTLRNVGTSFMEDRAAIRLANTRDCRVTGNEIHNAFFGIYLENTERAQVDNNALHGRAERETTSGNGIHVWHCRDLTIEQNDVSGHRDGIYFEFVESSTIRNNTSANNLRYGLHFMFSNDNTYTGNAFTDNGAGVAVMYSENVRMANNQFVRNWGRASYGLLLKDIRDSEIVSNRFYRNTIGIYSEGSNRVTVRQNAFELNGYAVRIMANCMDNVFTGNNFIGNAFDVTTNSRKNFNRFESNYWDAYKGYDLNNDGIGDVPHHPVRLFAFLVEKQPAGIILMNSLFVHLVDIAERVVPVVTPETLVDEKPLAAPARINGRS